jgi:hypothetical protein
MAAEWMVRKKEIKHGHLLAALTEKDDSRSRSKTFLAPAIKSARADNRYGLTVVATACRVFHQDYLIEASTHFDEISLDGRLESRNRTLK